MSEAPAHSQAGRTPSRADRAPLPRYRLVRRTAQREPEVASLGAEQLEVMAHRAGPLLVVGGPGTGKTTALVESVAARVAEGVEPGRILVLTFGRRAAAALRDRIEARIGRSGPDRVSIPEPVVRTFPAYAFGLLRLAAAERGEPAPRLLTGPEQDAVIRDLLDAPDAARRWPSSLRRAVGTRAFAAELRDLLLRAAERGIGARMLADLGRRHDRPEWIAAADFLDEYQRVLALRDGTTRGSVAYDQAELVRAAAALLVDDPAMLAAERERCRHVYVDELADTDPAQIDLLGLVAGGGTHVVGFADPDSATFAFRGADPTGVRTFTERFPTVSGDEAPRIGLPVCFRSTPELVAASRRVAARLRGPAGHRSMTARAPDSPAAPMSGKVSPAKGSGTSVSPTMAPTPAAALQVCTLRSLTSESAFIAQRLREAHLHEAIPWSRMAVIVRSLQHHHAALRRALTQAGVPVTTGADDTALATQPAVAPILLLVRCALDESILDEENALTLLHSALGGADPFAERRLRQDLRDAARRIGDGRPSGELLVEALLGGDLLATVEQRRARPARAVADLIAMARDVAANPSATAEDVLWAVWRASGLAERWAALSARGGRRGATADRDLDAVLVLFDAAARFTDRLPGARIEVFLDHLLDQQLPADTLAPSADLGEAVRILTAHAAKGLEWDLVAVAGVQEGVWPDLRLRGSVLGSERLVDISAGRDVGTGAYVASQVSAILDEERRLFYVAVTRARRSLLVTAVDPSSTGAGGEEQPSRFLGELVTTPTVTSPTVTSPTVTGPTVTGPTVTAPEAAKPAADPATGPVEELAVAAGTLRRPLTLPALAAELRTVAGDDTAPGPLRRAAAQQLARLAAAGVPGADPDEWWGLRSLSDGQALVDPGRDVRVSPSNVESVLRCGLRWLLERHGGSDPPTAKQGLGNLVHGAAMLADAGAGHIDAQAMRDYVAARFNQIELSARWLGQRERNRAAQMVDKLLSWLAINPREQIAIEREFASRLQPGPEAPAVLIRGRVDRLERDADGRLVVVDLKTGSGAPSAADTLGHAQLAAYQVAVEAGAFAEGDTSGGAEIVAVGTNHASAAVRVQPPLAEADDPAWGERLVRDAATAMAASAFRAVVNDSCPYCAVRTSCPLSGQGRQVTT